MRGLNIAGTVVFMLIVGLLIGISINSPNGSASASDVRTVYLEKPGRLTFGNFNDQQLTNVKVDLTNQKVSVDGNSPVNVNVTTAIKQVVKYKYKTIIKTEYVPIFRFTAMSSVPVKPVIPLVSIPGHIDKI